MDSSDTAATPVKDRTKRLRRKVDALKEKLLLANLKIVELEKENTLLQTASTELREQLSSMTIKLELQERAKPHAVRFSSFPLSNDVLVATPQRKRNALASSQSMAGSADSSTPNGAHTDREQLTNSCSSTPGPPSPSRTLSLPTSSIATRKKSTAHMPSLQEEEEPENSPRFASDGIPRASRDLQAASHRLSFSMNHKSMEHALEAEELELVLQRLRKGEKLDEEDLFCLASQYFDGSALMLEYLSSQSAEIIPTEPIQSTYGLSRSDALPVRALVPNLVSASAPIGFLAPFAPTCFSHLHSSPFPCFTEQASKIRLLNTNNQHLHITVYTFASNGCFLGFTLSRSTLRPHQDSRLTLSLVGTSKSQHRALAFTVLAIRPITTPGAPPPPPIPVQYFCFGSNVELTPAHPNQLAWNINVARVMDSRSYALLSTATSIVYPANVLGSQLTSRVFKGTANMSDLAAFHDVTALCASLRHPNIASLIGTSDKHPFRIISQYWNCTLTTCLGATYAAKLRQNPQHTLEPASFSPFQMINRHRREALLVVDSRRKDVPVLEELEPRLAIALDILAGLSALHSAQKVHRDLTTDSIGLASSTYALIVDLSAAAITLTNGMRAPSSHRWLAPELSNGNGTYSTQSDIFAFGVILMDLVIGAPISMALGVLNNCTFNSVLDSWIDSLSVSSSYSNQGSIFLEADDDMNQALRETSEPVLELAQLVRECCDFDPKTRPPITDIERRINTILTSLQATQEV